MTKWIICRYGEHHIQSPHECKPVGIAFEKTEEDRAEDCGFIDMERFIAWLEKNDLCAFTVGYAKYLHPAENLPVMY